MRNLKDANVFPDGKVPSSSQLSVKIRHCRNLVKRTQQIFDTHELRMEIEKKLEVPEDEDKPHIAYHKIKDDVDDEEPKFTIIWTSKKLLARVGEEMTQPTAWFGRAIHSSSLADPAVWVSSLPPM